MPKLKSILRPAGVETAQRQRTCRRNRAHKIGKGERCLVIKEDMQKHNYCMKCAGLILERANRDLVGLIASVAVKPPP